MTTPARVDPARLIEFATAVYTSHGMPEADAHLVADTLVQADLWGHQSHGVLRLGWYLDRLRNGVMKPETKPEFPVDAGALDRMDRYIAEVKAVPAAKGFDEVFYLGEIEARNDVKHRSEGLSLPEDTLADLQRIAKETGLEAKLPF